MPPKPKFTRDEIAAAALAIIKEEGLDALTARGLGARLGASARPIFTVFQSMDEVKAAARELAFLEYREYIKDYLDDPDDFKCLGIRTVEFAKEYPELFRLLFLQKHVNVAGMYASLPDSGKLAEECAERTAQRCDLSIEEAQLLLSQLWLQVLAMGTICAVGASTLSREEIAKSLGLCFASTMSLIRSGAVSEVFAEVDRLFA